MGERSPEKAGVGGSIPSLATIVSITYRHSKNRFHSVSFQKLWSAETRISDETWRQDRSEVLSIPPQVELLPGSLERYLDTVEVWRSSCHGPTTVFKNLQLLPQPERATWAQVGRKFLCPRPILKACFPFYPDLPGLTRGTLVADRHRENSSPYIRDSSGYSGWPSPPCHSVAKL